MEVYIQGENTLIPIQEEVTAERIEEALGYTPADAEVVEDISNADDSTLYVVDKDGNIIAKIDKDGLHTTEVYIGDEESTQTVTEMIAAAVADLDVNAGFTDFTETDPTVPEWAKAETKPTYMADEVGAVDTKTFEDHEADLEKHLGDEIKLDNDDSLFIADKDGNIIAKFDGDGLDVTDLKVSSQPIDEYLSDIVENGGSACDHQYLTIQELIHNTTDCTTWKDLQYCNSCGKVHANRLHLAHSYGSWGVYIAPTCVDKGTDRRDCDRCDWYEVRDVAALGHSMETVAAQDPTVDSVGWYEHQKCSRCGYTEGYVEIPKIPSTVGGSVSVPITLGTLTGNTRTVIGCTPATITAGGSTISEVTVNSITDSSKTYGTSNLVATATISNDKKSCIISISGSVTGGGGTSDTVTITVAYTMVYSS